MIRLGEFVDNIAFVATGWKMRRKIFEIFKVMIKLIIKFHHQLPVPE